MTIGRDGVSGVRNEDGCLYVPTVVLSSNGVRVALDTPELDGGLSGALIPGALIGVTTDEGPLLLDAFAVSAVTSATTAFGAGVTKPRSPRLICLMNLGAFAGDNFELRFA